MPEQPATDQAGESDAPDTAESRDDRLQQAAQRLRERRALRGGGDQESD